METENWTVTSDEFESWDGTRLFFRTWEPKVRSDRALIVIHRGHEHSGRVERQIEDLGLSDSWAFSWDARGHGESPGERGDAESYYHLVKDLDSFVRFVSGNHGIPVENMVILANSVGAVTASAWVHDYAPRIRAMVLAAPAFRIRLYVPLAIPFLRLLLRIKPRAKISSYVKSRMLTHDPEQAALYDKDSLITRDISVRVLLGLHDTATRILADAAAIETPTLVLSAGSDWVVKNGAQQAFFEKLSSPVKKMKSYPGFFHAILHEKERQLPVDAARQFILEAFRCPVDRSNLSRGDDSGYTQREYDLLRCSPPLWKGLFFGLQRMALRTVGRLSSGISIGCETGFDSGTSLDYVYENEPRGKTFLGKWIDRAYLNAVGWRGIRERGENLQACLAEEIRSRGGKEESVRVLDVATGCGRYVLEVIRTNPDLRIEARLRDNTPRNVETGTRNAATMGVESVEFVLGDAFDKESLLAESPPPDIVIVSGLYELFPENAQVVQSLEGIAGVLKPGGSLIYTSQPWHPQIEMIARTCNNREGEPWIMRRRTQAEMDELVASVGLAKTRMLPDFYGIFSVSVALKPEGNGGEAV
ncbi:MAG: bifunctional alpha/beta hydrolase/class I SAM-dependent methyltransferase [Verrucomicrobiota bacterium]